MIWSRARSRVGLADAAGWQLLRWAERTRRGAAQRSASAAARRAFRTLDHILAGLDVGASRQPAGSGHVLSPVRALNRLAMLCYGSTTADPPALGVGPRGAPPPGRRARET